MLVSNSNHRVERSENRGIMLSSYSAFRMVVHRLPDAPLQLSLLSDPTCICLYCSPLGVTCSTCLTCICQDLLQAVVLTAGCMINCLICCMLPALFLGMLSARHVSFVMREKHCAEQYSGIIVQSCCQLSCSGAVQLYSSILRTYSSTRLVECEKLQLIISDWMIKVAQS